MKFPHPPSADADAPSEWRGPSKSQVKRDMLALQQLGAQLIALPAHVIRQCALPEDLREAVLQAQRITAHGARKRQMLYVGKLLRSADADAVRAVVAAARQDDRASVARMHALERWRDALLADDTAQTEFLDKYPGCDAQRLRQLVRGARAETGTDKPPRLTRQLFQFVKAAMTVHDAPLPPTDHDFIPRF
ncbi:MAG: ribosome biogenesis factor YjgA [Thiomonas sp.]|jgi:ribosome-associated protein